MIKLHPGDRGALLNIVCPSAVAVSGVAGVPFANYLRVGRVTSCCFGTLGHFMARYLEPARRGFSSILVSQCLCLWVRTGRAVLHLLLELLVSSGHLHIHLVRAQGTELGRARSLRGTSSSLPQTPFPTPGAAGAGFGAGREGCAGDCRPYCALARV